MINECKNNFYFPSHKRNTSCFHIASETAQVRDIVFAYQVLRPQQVESYVCDSYEAVLLLMEGLLDIAIGGMTYTLGPRRSVFVDKAAALYIPAGAHVTVTALHASEFLFLGGKSKRKGVPRIIPYDEMQTKVVGKDAYTRTVHTIYLSDTKGDMPYLRIGETINEPGKWSSFPPHKHATMNVPHESRFEEIYFFKTNPQSGFGDLHIYNESFHELYPINHNDCAIVTEGYHPVCAAPGVALYYAWVLCGTYPEVLNTIDPRFQCLQR